MQHRSKSKMWANDTVAAVSLEQGNAAQEVKFHEEKGQTKKSDGDLVAINGEEKNPSEKTKADQETRFSVHEMSDVDYYKSRIKNKWSDSDSSEDEGSVDGTNHGDSINNSDSSDPQNKSHHDPVENTLEPDVSDGEAEDGSSKENKDNDSADPLSSPKNKNDEVLESGRLFIRNLPYTCT